jgi:hypothetical protein
MKLASSSIPGARPTGNSIAGLPAHRARSAQHRIHAACALCGRGRPRHCLRAPHFSRRLAGLERAWLPRFSQVLATSASDAEAALAIAPAAHIAVYPNAVPWVPQPPRADENVVVFSGNMEYHPNLSAVRFFRAEVWPLLREQWPTLVWRLVGKNPAAVSRFTSGDPRIEVTGEVAMPSASWPARALPVVPLLAGSGTRLQDPRSLVRRIAGGLHHDRGGGSAGSRWREPADRR